LLTAALFAVASLLAYANGANDNFKGVASLYASRTVGYRAALAWGTGATFLGSLASIVFAQGLLATFSGKGLVPPTIEGDATFLLAVAAGAGGTVILATRLGFPISTTHGLVGGIVGAGVLAAGAELNVAGLASVFLLPLVASPVIALFLAAVLYWSLHGRWASGRTTASASRAPGPRYSRPARRARSRPEVARFRSLSVPRTSARPSTRATWSASNGSGSSTAPTCSAPDLSPSRVE